MSMKRLLFLSLGLLSFQPASAQLTQSQAYAALAATTLTVSGITSYVLISYLIDKDIQEEFPDITAQELQDIKSIVAPETIIISLDAALATCGLIFTGIIGEKYIQYLSKN